MGANARVGDVRGAAEDHGGRQVPDVPPFHAFLRPALVVLSKGDESAARDVEQGVAAVMNLTSDQLSQTIASGQGRVRNRVLWALSYLFQAGAVHRPTRGQYRISDRGRQLLNAHPERIAVADLRQFDEFREFQSRTHTSVGDNSDIADSDASESITPLEQIETASHRLDRAVAAEMIERIRQQPPSFLRRPWFNCS